MFRFLGNTLKDLFGVTKVVLYRTFVEWNWSKPQPMFNVLTVVPGDEPLFIQFLNDAQATTEKIGSPVSFGPFKEQEADINIYTTHYGSTLKFMRCMMALLFKGISAKRSKATQTTSWTYCEFTECGWLPNVSDMLILGIKGDWEAFIAFAREKQATVAPENPNGDKPAILSINRMKFNARGKAYADCYFALENKPQNTKLVDDYVANGGDFVLYETVRIPRPPF